MKPSPRRDIRRQALSAVLGLAMGLSNLLGYLMVLLLTRTLGPADFGGYTALSTYGVLLAIPAGAFQVVIARRISSRAGEAHRTSGVLPAGVLGVALLAVTAAMAPFLAGVFHVESAWSAVLLGAMLPPMLVTGCFQGILLGRHRLRDLSVLYLITAVSRLVAASVAAAWDFDVRGVFAVMLLASVITAAAGAWLTRADLRALRPTGHGLSLEMMRSNSTLAAYVALTNVDVLLARHFLDPHESGGYALASTFGRAMCWGTQFIALIIVPRMHGTNPTRTLLRAGALVTGIGVIGAGLIAIDPEGWIGLAGGAQFTEYGSLALICVGLGVAWALAQVWLFSEMGNNSGALGAFTWAVIAAQVGTIYFWAHDSAEQIVAVCVAGAVLIAVVGLLRVVRRHQRPAPLEPDLLAVADRP
ncbi:oligosaccharide flippase family protein [Yimella sp. cx-573]|nr:oligosaccharide flippase family protein [Yimella sp. cx-573]